MEIDNIEEIIKELNHVRKNPISFVPTLEQMSKYFMDLEY
jgi:hypothetical protein